MADHSNFCVWIPALPPIPGLAEHVKDSLIGEYTSGDYYSEEVAETSIDVGANEVALGSVDNLDAALTDLVVNGWKHECPECAGAKVITGGGNVVVCAACAGEGFQITPVPDFAWEINDEPAYEYLGSIIMHVPGLEDFHGMCDADGTVIVDTGGLVQAVNNATDLDELKAWVVKQAGTAHLETLRRA